MAYDLAKFSTVGAANTLFSWEDVIANIGYKTFYGIRTDIPNSYALITSTMDSYPWRTTATASGTVELNFDHTFLAAADIVGAGFASFTEQVDGSAGVSDSIHLFVRLIHVDTAAAETEMVAEKALDGIASQTSQARRNTMNMDIPLTHFAVGEKLRLEVKITSVITSASTHLYHDPSNRGTPANDMDKGGTPRSDLQLVIPFRLPV